MNKYVAIIGSRQTPAAVLAQMRSIAYSLAKQGCILRSGGATGADEAGLQGYLDANVPKEQIELYLPWRGFNDKQAYAGLEWPMPKAYEIAKTIHPAWFKLSQGASRLHSRNAHQILGKDLATPSTLVLCWTPNGEDVGGTRTAVVLARRHGIPVINLGAALPK